MLLETAGRLWSLGVPLDWQAFWANEQRHRVPLPTYPFQRQSYWIEPDPAVNTSVNAQPGLHKKPDIADWFYLPSWKRTLASLETRQKRSWLVFTDEIGLGADLIRRLSKRRAGSAARLRLFEPGEIESLQWTPESPAAPGGGEVEIHVRATALNFADVLKATGVFPEAPFGMECAGVVTAVGPGVKGLRVGDEVVAIGPDSHATRVIRDARLVAAKPEGLSFEEAVTLPAAYMTAWYALHRAGNLQRGERILIHAASGGVGLAAVQVARQVGAEIFATAGNTEKREYLKSLGIRHVFDSRTLAFADEVMQRTGGAGVDVVLNSLTGDFIPKSLGVLGAGGRFLEIGKKELLSSAQIAALRLNDRVSYQPIDLTRILRDDPEMYGGLLHEVVERVRRKELVPLPRKVFGMSQTLEAFQYMLQTRHIGKVVLSLQEPEREVFCVRAGEKFRRLGEREFEINPGRDADYVTLLESIGDAAGQLDGVAHLWNVTAESAACRLARKSFGARIL